LAQIASVPVAKSSGEALIHTGQGHQRIGKSVISDKVTLTTTAGAPIADNQNAITAGRHGPVLLQDYQLLETFSHQNRERFPERTVLFKG